MSNLKKLKDGIYYNDSIHLYSLNDDEKRLTLCHDESLLKNPRFLFVSFSNNLGEITFECLKDSDNFKWEYNEEKYISNKNNKGFLGINDCKLLFVDGKIFEWEIIDNKFLFNKNNRLYLSCDLDYNIELTSDKKYAIPFYFSEYGVHYIKSKFRLDFDSNNLLYDVDVKNIVPSQITSGPKNIGLLLIGGVGKRFDLNVKKQLYEYNSVHLFLYSLKILVNTLDSVVIVVNSGCLNEINNIMMNSGLNLDNIYTVVNDVGDRLESIEIGLDFIEKVLSKDILNVLIHDGSRPFIKEKNITDLISEIKDNVFYSQYYLNLTNGLLKIDNSSHNEINRDDFIEICTPVCANFGLYKFLFSNYIKKERRICYEIIPLLDLLKIEYKLVKGSYTNIRKITTKDDLD